MFTGSLAPSSGGGFEEAGLDGGGAMVASYEAMAIQRLACLARDGERGALAVLWRRCESRVFAVALRIVKSREDADDVVQQTALTLVRKIGQFRGDAHFTTWLHRLTVNESLMYLRTARRERGSAVNPLNAGIDAKNLEDEVPDPESQAVYRDLLRQTLRAMASLEEPLTGILAVAAQHDRGDDWQESAGVDRMLAKSRLHRARRFLRRKLEAAQVPIVSLLAET